MVHHYQIKKKKKEKQAPTQMIYWFYTYICIITALIRFTINIHVVKGVIKINYAFKLFYLNFKNIYFLLAPIYVWVQKVKTKMFSRVNYILVRTLNAEHKAGGVPASLCRAICVHQTGTQSGEGAVCTVLAKFDFQSLIEKRERYDVLVTSSCTPVNYLDLHSLICMLI